MLEKFDSLIILGATASGKTKLAAHISNIFDGEIISADSRQVYKQLIIGAGKDYEEYNVNNSKIKYHLIDIASIDKVFYLKDFVLGAHEAFFEIINKKKLPIICGGTGLYLDALLKNFDRIFIPENETLRNELIKKTNDELTYQLKQYKNFENNKFDVNNRKRLVRAIEILDFEKEHFTATYTNNVSIKPLIIGLESSVNGRRNKITNRLNFRLQNGLIEEVEGLLENGYTPKQLIFLGLEYKYIVLYLSKTITFLQMKEQLEIAIHQFAKRQATWFRKMEREGFHINWINSEEEFTNQVEFASKLIQEKLYNSSKF